MRTPRPVPRWYTPLVAAFGIALAALLLARALSHPLNHDEHQFLSAGWLLVDGGLLPYRDYAFLHTPYLSLAYAPLLAAFDHGLLAARLLNAFLALLAAGVLSDLVHAAFPALPPARRILLAAGSALVLVANPLFIFTSGRAWNHDLPTLLTLLALTVVLRSAEPVSAKIFALSGLLAGLAVGARLSHLTAALALAAAPFLLQGPANLGARARSLLAYAGGLFLAVAPVALLAALAPRGFFFGNWVYPQLNTLYRQALGHRIAMTWGGKLRFLAAELLDHPLNMVLLAFFLLLVLWPKKKSPAPGGVPGALGLVGVLALGLLAGSFAPTPTWRQYLYAPVPFLVLGAFYGLARLSAGGARGGRWLQGLSLVIFVGSLAILAPDLARVPSTLGKPSGWPPVQIHELGQAVAERVDGGPVLTLAPIVPLEGGLTIDPGFASGPFVWRTAGLLSPGRRALYQLVGRDELAALLDARPPSAILVGFEGDTAGFMRGDLGGLERVLAEAAAARGYQPVPLNEAEWSLTLWLPPAPASP